MIGTILATNNIASSTRNEKAIAERKLAVFKMI